MPEQNITGDIKARSTRLCRVVSVMLVCVLVLLVLERFGAVSLKLWKQGFDQETSRRLALQCVRTIPEGFYLLALGGIRQSLAALARGELFTRTISHMLYRVGIMLATGAFINVFLVPGLAWLLGNGPGYLIAYDVSGLVLGAIGLSLTIFASVLRRAGQIQSELEEIF